MSYDFVTAWAEFPPVEEMAAEAAALEEVTCQQTGFGTLGGHMCPVVSSRQVSAMDSAGFL